VLLKGLYDISFELKTMSTVQSVDYRSV